MSREGSHAQSEKKYRTTLKDHFSTLLHALPDVIAESTGPFKSRSTAGKATTKAETLDRAMGHIQNLEADERKLKEESLVLRGQVAVYERLLAGRGGLWQKWPES